MKATASFFLVVILLISSNHGVSGQVKLYTEDLTRFYKAFDSVVATDDTLKQEYFIQKLYIDKASTGLKEFIELRGGDAQSWRQYIMENKSSLSEKRPWILSVLDQELEIRSKIAVFKSYYPDFRDGDIYFFVGTGNIGGTIHDKTVYIGTEVFASDRPNWALDLVLHEFVHTQQWTERNPFKIPKDEVLAKEYLETHKDIKERIETHKQLLGKSTEEGMADFVSELVLGKSLSEIYPEDHPTSSHTSFGLKHEQSVWNEFKKDMFSENGYKGWLYGWKEIDGKWVTDLGYFVGRQICRSSHIHICSA